jgi:hypothetical protein
VSAPSHNFVQNVVLGCLAFWDALFKSDDTETWQVPRLYVRDFRNPVECIEKPLLGDRSAFRWSGLPVFRSPHYPIKQIARFPFVSVVGFVLVDPRYPGTRDSKETD